MKEKGEGKREKGKGKREKGKGKREKGKGKEKREILCTSDKKCLEAISIIL